MFYYKQFAKFSMWRMFYIESWRPEHLIFVICLYFLTTFAIAFFSTNIHKFWKETVGEIECVYCHYVRNYFPTVTVYLGSMNWMAPEVLERPYDERSDIWSLGSIVLEMTTCVLMDVRKFNLSFTVCCQISVMANVVWILAN